MIADLVIIKVGTGVLTKEKDGRLDGASLVHLVSAVAEVVRSGKRCIVVSSGAVGAGVAELGIETYPQDVPTRQACASVGQTSLMHRYQSIFQNFELNAGQILLTGDDFETSERRGRILDTLNRLLEVEHIVPVINENDTVAVEEISVGDNDMLAARVASLTGAKTLILLTSVDGLKPPSGEGIVEEVADIKSVFSYAQDESGKFSIGGMKSKLKAVEYAVNDGIETIIANGRNPKNIIDLVNGQGIGTRFLVK